MPAVLGAVPAVLPVNPSGTGGLQVDPGPVPGGSRGVRGGVARGSPRTVSPVPVLVPVPDRPSLGERGCPARRRWLEGTRAELRCAASGNPRPRVTCRRLRDYRDIPGDSEPGDSRDIPDVTEPDDISNATEPGDSRHASNVTESGDTGDTSGVTEPGDIGNATESGDNRHPHNATEPGDSGDLPDVTEPGDSRATANVTRAHAGTYRCRATNAHGSAERNVTVTVECERLLLGETRASGKSRGERFWGGKGGLGLILRGEILGLKRGVRVHSKGGKREFGLILWAGILGGKGGGLGSF